MNSNSADEFFTWLGKCITAWAQVEEHLFEICVHSLGATRHRVAIVYYRTPTLDARLQLTNECPIYDGWRALLQRCNKARFADVRLRGLSG